MEGVNPYTAGLQGRPVEGEHNTESSSHVRVLSPVSTKVAGKTKHQVSEVREKESFEISEVSKRNNSEQTACQKKDWLSFFNCSLRFPNNVVAKLDRTTYGYVCYIYNMFNDKNYYEVTKAFPSVVEKLKSMSHTSAILYYVQSVGLISQLNCFSKCLQGFGRDCE